MSGFATFFSIATKTIRRTTAAARNAIVVDEDQPFVAASLNP
jgi:hypothetical protein